MPSLAFDPFNVDPLVRRRTQVLRLLLHCGHGRHDELAVRLVEIARRRHGPVIDEFVAVIGEQRWMRHDLRLYAAQRDSALRFFLAPLHSVPRREVILDLVGRRYPETAPRELIRSWAERLSG